MEQQQAFDHCTWGDEALGDAISACLGFFELWKQIEDSKDLNIHNQQKLISLLHKQLIEHKYD